MTIVIKISEIRKQDFSGKGTGKMSLDWVLSRFGAQGFVLREDPWIIFFFLAWILNTRQFRKITIHGKDILLLIEIRLCFLFRQ